MRAAIGEFLNAWRPHAGPTGAVPGLSSGVSGTAGQAAGLEGTSAKGEQASAVATPQPTDLDRRKARNAKRRAQDTKDRHELI